MPVTPVGSIAVAIKAVADLIANVPFFQTWTGTSNATQAAAFVFIGEVGFPVASLNIAGGVLTIFTRDVHNLSASQSVEIQGAAANQLGIAGPQTIAGVGSNYVTITTALGNLASTTPDGISIIPRRPLALVGNGTLKRKTIGTGGANVASGSVEILIEADVTQAYQNDPKNAQQEMDDSASQFIDGLVSTAGTGDLFVMNDQPEVTPAEFTYRPEQDNNAIRFERWRQVIKVTWGMED